MNIVISAINRLARIHDLRWEVRDEALRLAAEVAPRVGRSSWAERQARGLLMLAHDRVVAAREAEAREKEARFEAERLEREAQARRAFEEAGREAGGFCLVDTGRTGHGGHWPHWTVTPGAGGWASLEDAEAQAQARNARVAARWAEYIS